MRLTKCDCKKICIPLFLFRKLYLKLIKIGREHFHWFPCKIESHEKRIFLRMCACDIDITVCIIVTCDVS